MDLAKAMQYIEDGHKIRAVMYKYLFDEMKREWGEQKAVEVFTRATYARGKVIQQQFRKYMDEGDYEGLAQHFCDSSIAEGHLFYPGVEKVENDKAVLTMEQCPLVKAWKEMGLTPGEIKQLCEISSGVDYGTFESDGTELIFTHSLGAGDDRCRLIVQKKRKENAA